MNFKVKVRAKIDVASARGFALERHGDQDHGCLKIGEHLNDVYNNVCKHYDRHVNARSVEEVGCAAWLHDVVEDTGTSLEEISAGFGDGVEEVVSLLTDKAGRNRLQRHLRTYHAIRRDPDALLVKLCDRRHNQERSIRHGERYMAMYISEFTYFKFALWDPHRFGNLWSELDEQYEEMQRKMSW